MMIARHTGYEPGVFTHFVANEQIYDRHIEVAKELENRYFNWTESGCKPQLILNPDKKNFYDFTADDFQLIDYKPMKPQLKLELGI